MTRLPPGRDDPFLHTFGMHTAKTHKVPADFSGDLGLQSDLLQHQICSARPKGFEPLTF